MNVTEAEYRRIWNLAYVRKIDGELGVDGKSRDMLFCHLMREAKARHVPPEPAPHKCKRTIERRRIHGDLVTVEVRT